MFDRISPVYDVMNRLMTAGLDRALAPAHGRGGRAARATRVLDACCGTGDLALARREAGGGVTGLDFSERMLERARRKSDAVEWVRGDLLALPFADASFDAATVGFGIRNVEDLEAGLRGAGARAPARRPARLPRDHPAPRRAPALLPPLVRRSRAPRGQGSPRRRRLHVPAGQRAPLPRARGSRRVRCVARASARSAGSCSAAASSRSTPRRGRGMTALATVRAAPGLDAYLELLEERLERSVASHPGLVGEIGIDTLAAGGKRLRPVLVFLCTPPDAAGRRARRRRRRRGRARAHGDARPRRPARRCRPPPRPADGLGRARRDGAAKATGDYLFARAFAELAATGDADGVSVLAEPRRSRSRAARRSSGDRRSGPRRRVDEYLTRCSLKTGKLFEAACVLGGGRLELGRSGSRSASPSRSRTTSSTAPATSTRPGRRRASTCATGRPRCR